MTGLQFTARSGHKLLEGWNIWGWVADRHMIWSPHAEIWNESTNYLNFDITTCIDLNIWGWVADRHMIWSSHAEIWNESTNYLNFDVITCIDLMYRSNVISSPVGNRLSSAFFEMEVKMIDLYERCDHSFTC
jgi:hypothetical protein